MVLCDLQMARAVALLAAELRDLQTVSGTSATRVTRGTL